MPQQIEPECYVIAVSGGVDSRVLLHIMAEQARNRAANSGSRPLKLIVAHYDHGIRQDSREDRLFVQELAKHYGLPFVYDEGRLGVGASEADARTARYRFLHHVRRVSGASEIVTAHHQDDVLETMILNLLRGTGRKGLSSLGSTITIARPLLNVSKQELLDYARARQLVWHEDYTNQDQAYRRNYVRQRIMPRLSNDARRQLHAIIKRQRQLNQELDAELDSYLHDQNQAGSLDRRAFVLLPHNVAREVLAHWLRANGITNFDRPGLERLVIGAKISRPNSLLDIGGGVSLQVGAKALALRRLER